MEAVKSALSSFKSRKDLGDLVREYLTKSSIATLVLSLIAGVLVLLMGVGYGFSQSPANELTPCSAVIVLVTLITSIGVFLTTRMCCIVTKGSVVLLLVLEFVFCLTGIVLGVILFAIDKTCKEQSDLVALPWMPPRPKCTDLEPNMASFLLVATMFVWFVQILVLGKTLELLRQAMKNKPEVVDAVAV